jgi:large subunit ribosomal protein L21
MFAVLKTGGKQYKVSAGDKLRVEKITAEAGETVQFNEILMLGGDTVQVGAPFVEGAAVRAEVIDQIKGEKVINFVKRRRKHSSKRTKGHRQQLTVLEIKEILASGAQASAPKAAAPAGTKPANLLSEARDGQADDLKRITGVGPKLEGLLHENGVFHFDQIAAWTPEEIAYMDDQLSFKGRIERDNWLAQAAEFANEQE